MAPKLPDRVEQAIRDYAARVRERFGARLLGLSLYGSYARGEARPSSDVDVFVRVADLSEPERRELFELAADVSLAHLVTLQAFAPAAAEYEWLHRYECRILRDISEEGMPL